MTCKLTSVRNFYVVIDTKGSLRLFLNVFERESPRENINADGIEKKGKESEDENESTRPVNA